MRFRVWSIYLPKVPKGTRVLVTLTVTQSVLYPALTTLIIHTMDLSLYETAKSPVLIEPSSISLHVVSKVESHQKRIQQATV